MNKEVIIDIENPKDNDLISREALKHKLQEHHDLVHIITEALSAEPKTGHWIIIDDCEKFIAKCSECGQIEDSRRIGKYAYCHCGARMVE